MQDMNAFNLQLQMHKKCPKMLNSDIWNYKKMKR